MADNDENDDFTASLDDIFAAIGDALTGIEDQLIALGDRIWNHPINWEWLFYVALAVGLAMVGGFFLWLLWQLVEIAWLLIRRRMRRGS